MKIGDGLSQSGAQYRSEQVVELRPSEILDLCGRGDERLRELESRFAVKIVPRGNTLKVMGEEAEEVNRAVLAIDSLIQVRGRGTGAAARQHARLAMDAVRGDRQEEIRSVLEESVSVAPRKRSVSPLTLAQKAYIDSIRKHDIVFAVGPAGTGKTYLAMAMAVNFLTQNQVRRIVLVRPAVEAGEKLGFLPGDIAAKFDPFVRPLYDALYDMVEPERVKWMLENNVVEIAPLAFMRGRTLNSSFVILDEGQNTTVEQMKMFLTRLGSDSKAVVTGDVTQMDLPVGKLSGLIHARRVLKNTPGIGMVEFGAADVVRHELVQKILEAYSRDEEEREEARRSSSNAVPDSPTDLPSGK